MKTQSKTMIKASLVTLATLFFGGISYVFSPTLNLNKSLDSFLPTSSEQVSTELNMKAAPVEQARMLLRKVGLTGKPSAEPAVLDSVFAARVGQLCTITRDKMRAYLEKHHINEWEVGGTLDLPLCTTSTGEKARYMVIHDTSFPHYNGSSFPSNIDDESWEWNRFSRWVANVTHIYVNRVGDSKTMTPFHEGKTATKMERFVMGDGASKGLYLHIELIQPRKPMKGYGRHNDVDAPDPGFTTPQYKRLAELYTVASVRKGEWLIPGFHACVDQGIRYAHDDPQNFELDKFFTALREVWSEVEQPVVANRFTSGSGNGE